MKLYIVRHGQTELNVIHVLQGNLDSKLTEKGIQGAEKIGEALAETEFDVVITSTLSRAVKTTEIILRGRGQEFIQTPEVGEMTFGEWQGKTQEEISKTKEDAENYINYFKHPEKYVPVDNGEDFSSLLNRAKKVLEQIKAYGEDHKDAKVLLVSHGAFIKAIMSTVKNLELKDFWSEPYITNCSLTIIEIEGDAYNILLEADTSHLGEHVVPMPASGYVK